MAETPKKNNPDTAQAQSGSTGTVKMSPARNPSAMSAKKRRTRQPKRKEPLTGCTVVALVMESLLLIFCALLAIITLLGFTSTTFAGTRFFAHLVPFLAGIVGLILAIAGLLLAWLWLRRRLWRYHVFAPLVLAASLAFAAGILSFSEDFFALYRQFRLLLGGREEANRVQLTHQVYAAYRRLDPRQLHSLIERAKLYAPHIDAAAHAFDVDADLLYGMAAVESSYLVRDSKDGGQGLFQITLVPDGAMKEAARRFGVEKLLLSDQRHNAYLAAATLCYYTEQMQHDLFLALLAYNIGPRNGGLHSIMQQYAARDFVTIQPYLQQLPREYPIRVLSHALAFRLVHKNGTLLAYEEGLNAVRIQHVGIPGLSER